MDQNYQEIATTLASACPSSFTEAWVEAEVNDGHTKQQIWCSDGSDKSQPTISAMEGFKISKSLLKIKDVMPNKEWSRCTFRLFSNGEFKFDIHYDD